MQACFSDAVILVCWNASTIFWTFPAVSSLVNHRSRTEKLRRKSPRYRRKSEGASAFHEGSGPCQFSSRHSAGPAIAL